MNMDQEIYPVEVFDGNDWDASLVKSLLDNAEIESFLKDQLIGVLAPFRADAGAAGPVKIFVSNVDYEKAKEVIEQYEKAEGIR
jgi:hypothetical protein